MADPSVALADAFKSISHATVTALRAYEQGSRTQLTQIDDEIRAARRERDDALAAMYTSQQMEQASQQEVEKWKAELAKADTINLHQAELVAQLRREAQQWKDQCLRLQETSRGEIEDWKEQFLRVDRERTRLTSLLEQVAVSASINHAGTAPYTPRRPLAYAEPSTASTATKRASTSSTHALPQYDKTHIPTPKKPRLAQQPDTVASTSAGMATPGVQQLRVIRRVQAVIHVPVKEEEEDPEQGVGFGEDAAQAPASPAKRRRSAGQTKGRRVVSDDEEEYADDSGDYVDDYEGEESGPDNTTTRVRRVSQGQARRPVHQTQEDEEDDELMMGAEDNPQEIYGHQRVVASARPKSITNTSLNAPSRTTAPATSRKRKQPTENADGGTVRARKRK